MSSTTTAESCVSRKATQEKSSCFRVQPQTPRQNILSMRTNQKQRHFPLQHDDQSQAVTLLTAASFEPLRSQCKQWLESGIKGTDALLVVLLSIQLLLYLENNIK